MIFLSFGDRKGIYSITKTLEKLNELFEKKGLEIVREGKGIMSLLRGKWKRIRESERSTNV